MDGASLQEQAATEESIDSLRNDSFDSLGETKAELLMRLVMDTTLIMEATEDDDAHTLRLGKAKEKWLEAMRMIEDDVSNAMTTINAVMPRLVTLNEDLHLYRDVAILYYVREGDNRIGTADSCTIRIPHAEGCGVVPVHAVVVCDALRRVVTIVPSNVESSQRPENVAYIRERHPNISSDRSLPPRQDHYWAYRFSPVVAGDVAADCAEEEFSRECETEEHTRMLECHERLEATLEELSARGELLVDFKAQAPQDDEDSGNSGDEESSPQRAKRRKSRLVGTSALLEELSDEQRSVKFSLAESETRLVAQYPLTRKRLLAPSLTRWKVVLACSTTTRMQWTRETRTSKKCAAEKLQNTKR